VTTEKNVFCNSDVRSFGAADVKPSHKDDDEKVDETSSLMPKVVDEVKPSFTQSASLSYIRPNANASAVPAR
jgi:hypothetical protein